MNRQKQFRINAENWNEARQRYLNQGWRARIFCDLIISDISSMPTSGRPTLLDIGCGKGFDCDLTLSEEMAKSAGRIIGIEPDPNVRLAPYFTETHQCIFEQAPLPSSSVDLAWAVMVLEHLERPELFWDKLSQVLKPGGIFWGITVDARHWFVWGSQMMESLRVKDAYLNVVRGTRGVDRYENYPVYYRSNTLKALRYLTRNFSQCDVINFIKVGQINHYLPKSLAWFGNCVDQTLISFNGPGSLLAVRVVR